MKSQSFWRSRVVLWFDWEVPMKLIAALPSAPYGHRRRNWTGSATLPL
jgi:hypothetical protein